ncbi:ESX secretion-associated protein EspG [Nocardia otitidiscaviarum]|uniref:ESX secretion-associated protein EspG n=1 Tax=Nocardia otitidiscaviarum TaxID=1823 RepID=A0A516NVR5_9NOCA|nr:ESX secretion-associated protein EspG [Nocardia otitidiscaviarum]MCP9622495.1 ESX secretion-associated protein EspG [Nocardia otitidiscaviarum]QDP83002.1 ESX secretion-associated protein EspG [Nocardia otitidiscaviarum]
MNTKWLLTPEEFSLIWTRETRQDRRPYPLHTIPTPETPDTAQRLRHRFLRRTDPELTAALMLCARSDATTVTLFGERTAGPAVRAFAAVAQQRAGVLIGLPDAVSVMVCPAERLGRELVEAVGSAPAGRLAPLREPQDAVLSDAGGHRCAELETRGDAALFRRKLNEPVDGRGFITVSVDPANPLSPPTRHRTWLDFSDDGRYLLTTDADLTLTPVNDEDFAAALMHMARL